MKKWKDQNQYERLCPFVLRDIVFGMIALLLIIWTAAAVMGGSVPAAALAGIAWAIWWGRL